jgi:uncharacterized protein
VVELASAGAVRILACPLLLDELEQVLHRERFLRWRSREQLDRFVADIRALAEVLDDPADVPPATRDPGDDYLVALARGAGASAICSGDDDLAEVDDVLVLSPAELVRRLSQPG